MMSILARSLSAPANPRSQTPGLSVGRAAGDKVHVVVHGAASMLGLAPWRHSASELVAKWGVKSGINIPEFERLSVGCDVIEQNWVVKGLRDGYPLGVNEAGPFPPQRLWAESRVSHDSHARITEYLVSEREEGRVFGPFSEAPNGKHWQGTVVYPMSETQRSDGKFRTISDLSFRTPLDSINGFIPREESTTSYPSFDDVAKSICAIGLMVVFFALFDVRAAYRNLRVSCTNWRFGIIAWRNLITHAKEWWLDTSLVFGGKSGCRIYNRFGGVLAFILRKHGFLPEDPGFAGVCQVLIQYLDDHLVMAQSLYAINVILDRMLALMALLRVPVKEVKTIRAVTEIKFLGYYWLPRLDLVSLDPVRWATVELQLRTLMDLLTAGRANADSLRSVTGVLVWAAKVIPGGKVFTRGLYQVIRLVKATSLSAALARKIIIRDHFLIRTALDDLGWWLAFV